MTYFYRAGGGGRGEGHGPLGPPLDTQLFSYILEAAFLSFLTSNPVQKTDKNITLVCTSINFYVIRRFVNLHFLIFMEKLLVSTYTVCERLSVMQGLPELGMANFLLILPRIPPPSPNENLVTTWHFEFWIAKSTPVNENLVTTWHFEFRVAKGVWRLTTVSSKDTV